MIYTFEYDRGYPGPAFPSVDVTLQNVVDSSHFKTCSAWVDSGADGTLIPVDDLREIGARKVDQKRMFGVSGIGQVVDIYEIALQLGPHRFSRVYAIADSQNKRIILGRDILNYLEVTLNGVAQVVEVLG